MKLDKMLFVQFNNRILDYSKLRRERIIVQNHMLISVCDLLRTYGFEKTRNGFVNKDLNMKIKLKFDKVEKEVFV
ncbi:MAG: hypothetical protein KKF89_04300 [Nanoarchaeota archaeon]|nr:hypothetical protein [Nanoarchaeota archaeon]MBU1854917.1 hypothetical protein [Nanoarchaeota archaeon]